MVGKGADFSDDTDVIFGEQGPSNEAFSLALWMRPGVARNRETGLLTKSADGKAVELLFDKSKPVPGTRLDAHLVVRLMHQGAVNATVVQSGARIPANKC